MALKILYAGPDMDKSGNVKKSIQQGGYQVDIAHNGRDTQRKVSSEKYFVIILDYKLKDHSALEVLKFIRTKQAAKKILLLVDTKEVLEENNVSKEKIEKSGVVQILIGEQSGTELLEQIEGNKGLSAHIMELPKREGLTDVVEEVGVEDDYTKVQIENFYTLSKVIFDVYIKISNDKFLKIFHAGDELCQERIEKYKQEKDVKYLYFKNKERRKYLQLLNHVSVKMTNNDKVKASKKILLFNDTTEMIINEICAEGMKPLLVEEGLNACRNVQKFVSKQKDLYMYMRKLDEFDPSSMSHAFMVTFLASSIVRQFDWQQEKTIETISLAGMLHDIGKSKLPPLIAASRPGQMDEDQLKIYYTHPAVGAEMVGNIPNISTTIPQLILYHHERCDGTGFPNGLNDSRLSALSKILIISNYFSHMIVEDGLKPVEAMKTILSDSNSGYKFNGKILEHFCKVFIDPEKIKKEKDVIILKSEKKKPSPPNSQE